MARDLVGQTFGRLLVLGLAPREQWPLTSGGYRLRSWACVCSCGVVLDHPIPTTRLRSGVTSSCGCRQREVASIIGRTVSTIYRPVHARRCVGCHRAIQATVRQKYCTRACKEQHEAVVQLASAPGPCRNCGGPVVQPRRGATRLYCDETCKRAHARRRAHQHRHGTLADQARTIHQAIDAIDALEDQP